MAAIASPYPDLEMSPESSEGRERITRLEERVDSNRRQIETFAPLVRQVERVEWRLDELADDFKQFRGDLREQREADGRHRTEELSDLRRSVSDQILVVTDGLKGCSNKITELAEAQQAWQESERVRRERERERREEQKREDAKIEAQTATEKFIARYGLRATIGAALVAAAASILNTVLS
jgi:small-conductance mechanosensitive channel